MPADEIELPYNPETSKRRLGERKSVLYLSMLEDYYTWMRESGKTNRQGLREGMSEDGASNTIRRIDQVYRLFWEREPHQSVRLSQSQADLFVDLLKEDKFSKRGGDPYSSASKRKFSDALRKYFEWRAREKGGDEWTPDVNFTDGKYNITDFFEQEELRRLREASYDYGSIPNYKSLSPSERGRWKAELAQRLEKPKDEISIDDWDHVNTTWKFTSLMLLSQDTGLRPCEVHNASIHWLRLEKETIAIPKEESSKDRNNWEVAIRDDTVEVLKLWKQERQANPKYDDTDAIWLNHRGNRYNSKSLNYFLNNLLEEMDFNTENRKLSWYSIRHGLGTHVADEMGVMATKEQLRQKSLQSTERYVHPSLSSRRDALDNI